MSEQQFWNPVLQQELQLSPEEQELYLNLLFAAKDAKAFPRQSGFVVRAAVMTAKGEIELGGNDEYAFSDAFVHGETSALAAALTKYGDTPIKALAFYSIFPPSKEPIGGSCGNCRDVFKEYVDQEMLVIEGDGTFMTVSHFGDGLFENFNHVSLNRLDPTGVTEAERGIAVGVDVYLPKHLKEGIYGAAIVGASGKVWQGSLDTNAAYDATTPLVAARQVWRNAGPEAELRKIVIARYGALPKPLYRDRQAILELDEALMDYTGRFTPLPVELVELDQSGRVMTAALTNTREWMPMPFTAGSFGMSEAVRGSLKGLFPRES